MIDAVIADDASAVARLLDAGHDVNARNANGESAFSYACANNSLAVAMLLHARGADVNTIDHGNGSPLDWAVCWSSPEFCAWLESFGGRRHDVFIGRPDTKSELDHAASPEESRE
jgi:ankyrin repeat protein